MARRVKQYDRRRPEPDAGINARVRCLVDAVAEEIGVPTADVWSYSRRVPVPDVRHSVAYALVVNGGLSLNEVAPALGYADHTTVVYAVDRCRATLLDYEQSKQTREPLQERRAVLIRAILRALSVSAQLWAVEDRATSLTRGGAESAVALLHREHDK